MKPLRWRPGDEVVYQIFPDRWRNADPSNDPKPGAWTHYGRPIETTRDPHRLAKWSMTSYYGGDLAGVRESIPYLETLGVTAVYLTPIFEARTTHRYDTYDYHRIDPSLGTRADFEALSGALRAAGMRLVLDGVFNHTGREHPWHADPRSRRRLYCMRSPSRAMGWLGGRGLPKLDVQNPEAARRILEVIDAWPEADAWRLDAAHLLPRSFLRKLRLHAAPRPTIVEDWNHAAHYFRGRGAPLADGVTNFLFRDAVDRFLCEDCSPETFLERLRVWVEGYPWRAVQMSWNFLDNHDTPRMSSHLRRPERLRLAFLLQFTLPGLPMLYQGDEVGMRGRTGGEARAPMPWDRRRWDRGLLEHVRALSRLRAENPVLRRGRWRPLYADNRTRTLAYERTWGRDRAVVALNDGYRRSAFRAGGLRFSLAPGAWEIRFR